MGISKTGPAFLENLHQVSSRYNECYRGNNRILTGAFNKVQPDMLVLGRGL